MLRLRNDHSDPEQTLRLQGIHKTRKSTMRVACRRSNAGAPGEFTDRCPMRSAWEPDAWADGWETSMEGDCAELDGFISTDISPMWRSADALTTDAWCVDVK